MEELYRATNIAGQDIDLDYVDASGGHCHITISDGDSLDGLNRKALKFLNRYVLAGLFSLERDSDWHDWRKEGF